MLKINGPLSFVLVGLFIAIFVYSLFLNVRTYYERFIPNLPVFEATLLVPDFKTGEDAVVQYHRDITASFIGQYFVEVKSAETGKMVCHGEGEGSYTPEDHLYPPIFFSWYVNSECVTSIPPGQYFVETVHVINQEDKPEDHYTTISNIFTVTP